MRRVVPIEQLLERLAQLEHLLGGSATPPAESSFAATAEKKTLIFEPGEPVDEPPEISARFELEEEPVFENNDVEPVSPPESVREFPTPSAIDLSFIDSLPVKLAPIDSEALEHVEDTWLDAAYELKLSRSGDDLLPILSAAALAEGLFGKAGGEAALHAAANGSNGSAAAAALRPVFVPPDLDPVDEPYEPISLAENATDEELLTYAANHPLAKRAMRIFRAKIVEVKRI